MKRTILAAGVLLGGAAAALLFRHPSLPGDPPAREVSEPLVLRKEGAPSSQPPARRETFRARDERPASPAAPKSSPAVLTPMDPGEPIPALARAYSRPPWTATPGWDMSGGMTPPRADMPGTTAQTHRIADGDTLEGLAQRYLGAAARADEIYRANRDVLSRPDILPIGAELKIPPRGPAAQQEQPVGRPLMPIPSAP